MRHIQIAKSIIDMDQGLKTSNTSKGKAFPKISTRPSYQSTSKVTSPKTPEAPLVAAQTYLYTTRPSPGDPREHIHRAALQGLRMVGNKLTAKEEEAHHNKGAHKSRSPRRHTICS
jgi:hypothetical protein